MKTRIVAISLIASLASAGAAHCCTAFLASYGDIVLAGNNEEYMGTARLLKKSPESGIYIISSGD
jgi:hypothetical protein